MSGRSLSYYSFKIRYRGRKLVAFFQKSYSVTATVLGVLLCCILFVSYNIHSRLYSPDYVISRVQYTKDTVTTYNDAQFYGFITDIYSGKYYSDIELFGDNDNYTKLIQQQYPFVRNVSIHQFIDNTVVIHVDFYNPKLRFLYHDMIYGAYDNYLLMIGTHDMIGKGIPLVLLPIYLKESSSSISGLLYNLDLDRMLYDLLLLRTAPLSGSITYVPGGNKYILWNNSLRIYFNSKKDINEQLMKLSTLRTQYQGYSQLKQIDIGSLDNPIVK